MGEQNANSLQGENNVNRKFTGPVNDKNVNLVNTVNMKSPSDTTIYAPALAKSPLVINQGLDRTNQRNATAPDVTEVISSFVDSMRLEQQEKERRRSSTDDSNVGPKGEARTRAGKAVLEAEKFRASVANPGMPDNQVFEMDGMVGAEINGGVQGVQRAIPNIGSGVSDDDFFHLTCHIDPNLIHKIEKGEFIELEKLLPKDKMSKNAKDRLEWVQCDGGTYLVPAQRDVKIGSFRKWEQAFKAYATIYCGANPHRSKEIWQYITVINTAASSYLWDNVYNYDITFRHLMAFNPNRSWAVTYNQMWNLSMRGSYSKEPRSKIIPVPIPT